MSYPHIIGTRSAKAPQLPVSPMLLLGNRKNNPAYHH